MIRHLEEVIKKCDVPQNIITRALDIKRVSLRNERENYILNLVIFLKYIYFPFFEKLIKI